ncbi:MAG TPA: NIPSNAP family protein [Candidatus Binatia bacterium]|nr:NIPSNAP family protein [Candidatus Binatia bacterium]
MKRRTLLQGIPAVALLSPAVLAARLVASENREALGAGEASYGSGGVYELRVYHAVPGKLGDLLARFRDHTTKLFERHGIENVAYWTPTDDPEKDKTLIYILHHPSREAAAKNWKAFQDDPEWKNVKEKSEANGPLVEKIDSTFMVLTDFSPSMSK